MSATGAWDLHYSWGSTASYAQIGMTLNADGTFTGPGTGKWRLRDGTLQLSFDGGPAKYGGTIDGLNGSWYLVRQGTVGIEPEAVEATVDAAGNELLVPA
jgi:autotransporter translocation and assembly factor TamB